MTGYAVTVKLTDGSYKTEQVSAPNIEVALRRALMRNLVNPDGEPHAVWAKCGRFVTHAA